MSSQESPSRSSFPHIHGHTSHSVCLASNDGTWSVGGETPQRLHKIHVVVVVVAIVVVVVVVVLLHTLPLSTSCVNMTMM